MPSVPPVKGTRDFYPELQARQRWLSDRIRQVSESFGYQEYEAPYLERLDLYNAKSGEELLREQSFVFQDRGGDWITLRPELTPSLARMVAARRGDLVSPIRWWSYGPFWRYEKPQRGRTREFWQWNIDLLGVDSPWADAELAAVAVEFLRSVGLGPEKVRILVNNRRLAESQMDRLGIAKSQQPEILRWIDRRESMPGERWSEALQQSGLSPDQRRGLDTSLDQTELWKESPELVTFFEAVSAMGAADYVRYSPSVVRGLDYYTGTVFEARDTTGSLRAILGGGRYDNLVAEVGGEALPGVGFAMGDVVLGVLLEEEKAVPSLPSSPAQVLVLSFPEVPRDRPAQLASQLRAQGIRTEWYPQADRVPKQLKYADRKGIPLALLLGPDEVRDGTVTLKDLRSGRQGSVPLAGAGPSIVQWLSGSADA